MKDRMRIRRQKPQRSEDRLREETSTSRAKGDGTSNRAPDELTASPGERGGYGHDLSTFSVMPEQSGNHLPAEVQQEFGPALGMSLDQVRVHTGSPSANFAESMNAHAVTVGPDIHFGEGEYRPGSKPGDALLAHELIHVKQQKDAAPARARSDTPASLEHEADALGPQLLRGASVQPQPAAGLSAAAKPKAHDLQVEAEASEEYDKDTKLDDSKAVWQETLTATNVADRTAAEAEVKRIEAAEPELIDAIGTSWYKGMGNPSSDKLGDNRKAQLELGKFLTEAGMQSSSMSNFQQQYARLGMDMDRLDAMTVALDLRGQSGKDFAEGALKSQNLSASDKKRMSADTDNPDAAASGPLATKKLEVRQWREKMTTAAAGLGPAEQDMTERQYRYQAKVDDIAAGLQPREAPQAKKDLDELQAKLEKIKGYAKMATGFATKALGGYLGTAAGVVVEQTMAESDIGALEKRAEKAGEAAKDKVKDSVPDLANDFIGFLVTMPWESDLAVAEAKAHAALEEQTWHAKEQQLNELKADTVALKASMTRFVNAAVELERAKVKVRTTMEEVGRVADKSGGGGHGDKWETLATFLGESEAYLAQSDATIALGHNEMLQADNTGATREEITSDSGEFHWWSVRQRKRLASDSMEWVADKHVVRMPSGVGSAEGDRGANAVIKADLDRLETHKKFIQEFRDRVAKEFSGLQ